MQSDQAMLSDQFNFVDTNNFSDPSEQVAPRDQRTDFQTNPTKQQLLEAEIDKAFNEVFEIDQQNPTEDNPHAAIFDEMADDLYQTMLQEQAKEEAAVGLLPAQTNAAATGWTSDSNIQYNMQEEISAAPIAQQEYLRQFWDETKQRFSAVKLLFDTQPYGSFQPAFAQDNSVSSYDQGANHRNTDVDKLHDAIKRLAIRNKVGSYENLIAENPKYEHKSNQKNYSHNLGNYKFKTGIDEDFRGGKGTFEEAFEKAFLKTGTPKENFIVTKWSKDQYGKSYPVEWRAHNGAEVNIDIGHPMQSGAPTAAHIGWQTGGKRNNGGGLRGHIFLDEVPYNR